MQYYARPSLALLPISQASTMWHSFTASLLGVYRHFPVSSMLDPTSTTRLLRDRTGLSRDVAFSRNDSDCASSPSYVLLCLSSPIEAQTSNRSKSGSDLFSTLTHLTSGVAQYHHGGSPCDLVAIADFTLFVHIFHPDRGRKSKHVPQPGGQQFDHHSAWHSFTQHYHEQRDYACQQYHLCSAQDHRRSYNPTGW